MEKAFAIYDVQLRADIRRVVPPAVGIDKIRLEFVDGARELRFEQIELIHIFFADEEVFYLAARLQKTVMDFVIDMRAENAHQNPVQFTFTSLYGALRCRMPIYEAKSINVKPRSDSFRARHALTEYGLA
jgi:hypothetical protein